MTPFDVRAARALCDAATKGPWYASVAPIDERVSDIDYVVETDDLLISGVYSGGPHDDLLAQPDAEFIAAARTLLPAALDEIERLRAALAAERKACDEARRLMATPGTRSCPLCSATIPRDHDHRLATTQYARDWCAAHDARREGETL